MSIKCVLFDLDGTLIDSEPWQYESYRKAFLDFDFILTEKDFFRDMVVRGYSTVELIEEYNLSISSLDLFNRKTKYYKEFVQEKVHLRKGAIEIIKFLLENGIKIGLVTSSRTETTNLILEKFDLKRKFEVIITRDDVINRKPNKEPYEKALTSLEIKSEEAIVLEDNPCGVFAAKGSNVFCIALPNEFIETADFSNADLVMKDFFEVKDFIKQRLAVSG